MTDRLPTLDEEIASIPPVEQVAAFMTVIADPADTMELRMIRPEPKAIEKKWCAAAELADQIPALQQMNADGFNVYIGVNPRKAARVSGDENVKLARCHCADKDPANGFTSVDGFIEQIAATELPEPSAVVNSGHGAWGFWRRQEAVLDMAIWRAIQAGLAAKLGSDPTIKNPERIVRLPGFWNWKQPRAWAWLHSVNSTLIYPAHIFTPLGTISTPTPRATAQPIVTSSDAHAALLTRARSYLAKIQPAKTGNRDNLIFNLAGHLAAIVGEGGEVLTENEILVLLAGFNLLCEPPLPETTIVEKVRSAARNGTPREIKPDRPRPARTWASPFAAGAK